MRTDITETVGSSRVRVVVRATAWAEMIGDENYENWVASLHFGDPRIIHKALMIMMRDAGDLKPLQIQSEVERLMEEEGVAPLTQLVQRAITHALTKVEEATKNSPAGAVDPETVPGMTSSTQ